MSWSSLALLRRTSRRDAVPARPGSMSTSPGTVRSTRRSRATGPAAPGRAASEHRSARPRARHRAAPAGAWTPSAESPSVRQPDPRPAAHRRAADPGSAAGWDPRALRTCSPPCYILIELYSCQVICTGRAGRRLVVGPGGGLWSPPATAANVVDVTTHTLFPHRCDIAYVAWAAAGGIWGGAGGGRGCARRGSGRRRAWVGAARGGARGCAARGGARGCATRGGVLYARRGPAL